MICCDDMLFLTDFADQAVMLPMAVTVCLMLALAGWRRAALAWALVVPGTLLVVVLSKMAVMVGGHILPLHSLHSPSGHTASAAVVYGGLLALMLPEPARGARRPFVALLLGAAFATLFGGTRLALHEHTRLDVLAGALIGIAGAVALARLAGPRPPGLRRVMPLAAALVVVALFHGQHLRAEDQIDRVTWHVWQITHCCRPR
jgi:membrane-associated phospholipid phosphatase